MGKDNLTEAFVKKELLVQLKERVAYNPIGSFIEEIPFDKVGNRVYGLPYSFYEIFYHIVFSQRDILDFILNPGYRLPEWPHDYWPWKKDPGSEEDWKLLKRAFFKQLDRAEEILNNPEALLEEKVLNATHNHQTLLREVLLMISHVSYHTGQLQLLRRLL